jgi:lipopolysaccharide biosynthesis protein
MKTNPTVIALYLPQFHPTDDNNEWWGKGFTEWTNVGKAKRLFRGHVQPHVPADLGYYDLRLPAVREAQATMAREHGVDGFCYYHYWFGNGKRQLELPFNEVLESGSPDFPFCLCWANESWYAKMWNKDGSAEKKPLVEQVYPGASDHVQHFHSLLPAFQDKRYIRIHGKPLFMIYQPAELPQVGEFIKLWQKLAEENGLPGIYFVAHTHRVAKEAQQNFDNGFNAVNSLRLNEAMRRTPPLKKMVTRIVRTVCNVPRICSYKDVYPFFIGEEEKRAKIFPSLVPNWDHTPRSGTGGSVLVRATPELFGKHVEQVLGVIADRDEDENVVFIKSWNEWGEGNYMEPDLQYGTGYLQELKRALHAHSRRA